MIKILRIVDIQTLRVRNTWPFLTRDAMHKRGLCRHAVSVCLSVYLCDCVSVTFVNCAKTNKLFHHRVDATF